MCCNYILSVGGATTLETVGDISTIVIALVNTFLVWFIFIKTRNKGNEDKEQSRKLDLLKSLILDHNLKHFYSFFEKVESVLKGLKSTGLSDDQKSTIVELGNDEFIKLRKKFTDSLLAVDQNLYDKVLECSDQLQSNISNNAFDPGNNLSHLPKYEECIENPLQLTRTEILKILFQYKG
ncbi:hypothetical protein [Algoriphagus aquimarinus]|uniref:Uncharacterized protein n=1 Tax=Algoriphagus aquimarinus TaxID=237018 RepID=A0A5C7ARF3_9BACT|nr:hypothetical protein [Algoriphagus aquimarinus]TXE11230.1 hypothetical protein ESV85_11835 [Algoriphagus aquimarinus]